MRARGPRAHAAPKGAKTTTNEPDRYDEVVAILAGWDLQPRGLEWKNRRAVNDSGAAPLLIAEAYYRLLNGDWDDDFVRRRGSLEAVVENLGGYEAQRADIEGVVRQASPFADYVETAS